MTHQARPSRRAPRPDAFTLVELVLVIVIAGMVATVAVPRYAQSLARYRLTAAAERVAADLNYAREHAASRSKAVTAAFLPAAERYTLVGAGIEDFDHPGQAYTTRLDDEPYIADLVAADFGGTQTVAFDGYGSPTTGGTVTVGLGTRTIVVTLDADTGIASTP